MPARLAKDPCASVTGTVTRHAAVADPDATLTPDGMGFTAMGAQAAARPAHRRAARPEPMRRADALRDTQEDEIMVGQLATGIRLEEVALANRFGVSRTPMREALLQLAAAGLIETQPRRGAVVARIGPQRLQDMFEVLVELEAMAARLAARRVVPGAG